MRKATSIISASSTIAAALALFVVYRQGFSLGGEAAMGVWALASGVFAFARFGDSGMGVAIMRQVSLGRQRSSERYSAGPQVFAGLFIATLPVAVLGTILAFALQFYLKAVHSIALASDTTNLIVWYSLFYAVSNSATAILFGAVDGLNRITTRNILSIVSNIAFVASCLIMPKSWGIITFCISNLVLSAVQIILSSAVLTLAARGSRFEIQEFLEALRSSMSFLTKSVLIGAARSGFEPACKFLVGQFGGLAAIALFDLANRISVQVRQVTSSMMQPLSTVAARESEALDPRSVTTMWKWTRINFAISGLAASAQILTSPLVCLLVLKHQSTDFYRFNSVLAIGGFLNSVGTVAFFSEMAGGLLDRLIRTHVIMLAINVLGGLVLGYLFGATGVAFAWAFALTYGGGAMLARFDAENAPPDVERTKLIDTFLASLASALISWGYLGFWTSHLTAKNDYFTVQWTLMSAIIGLAASALIATLLFGENALKKFKLLDRLAMRR